MGKKNPYDSPVVRFGLYMLVVLMVCCAPIAGYFAVTRMMTALQSQDWPQASAEILASCVQVKKSGMYKNYKPIVKYRFEIQGKSYTHDQIRIHDVSYGQESSAQAVADRYPVGSKHQAYYQPDDPSVAVLDTGLNWRSYLVSAVPLAMLLIAWVAWKAARLNKS